MSNANASATSVLTSQGHYRHTVAAPPRLLPGYWQPVARVRRC